MEETIKHFFEQKESMTLLVFGVVAFIFILLFLQIKKTQNKMADGSLGTDVKDKKGGKKWAIILLLMLFALPLITYFWATQSPISEQISTNSSIGIIEKINLYAGAVLTKAQKEPHLGGLIIVGIGFIMLLAVIMNADWILDTRSEERNRLNFMLENSDRDIARIIMAVFSILLIIGGLLTWWAYK